MFSKRNDILDAERNTTKGAKKTAPLNNHVELTVKANSFANQIFPQSGELVLGEGGIEFQSLTSSGFIQIPWKNVEKVSIDIIGKRYVHAITVFTDGTAPLEFIISKGSDVVRVIAGHVSRDQLVVGPKNFSNMGKRLWAWLKKPFARHHES